MEASVYVFSPSFMYVHLGQQREIAKHMHVAVRLLIPSKTADYVQLLVQIHGVIINQQALDC